MRGYFKNEITWFLFCTKHSEKTPTQEKGFEDSLKFFSVIFPYFSLHSAHLVMEEVAEGNGSLGGADDVNRTLLRPSDRRGPEGSPGGLNGEVPNPPH